MSNQWLNWQSVTTPAIHPKNKINVLIFHSFQSYVLYGLKVLDVVVHIHFIAIRYVSFYI